MPLFAAGQVEGAKQDFGRFWGRNRSDSGEPIPLDEDEAAMRAEFGFAMTEIASFCGALIQKAFDVGKGYGYAPLDELIRETASSLMMDEDKVHGLFDLLMSRPRAEFLKPPKPYKVFDIWPWRFNRRLSYLRRPLLLTSEGDMDHVLWGPRHLFNAVEYLADLLFNGRLPAHGERQSAAMSTHQGRLNATRGPEFERRVEEELKKYTQLQVARSVKHIGPLKLGDVGDIDVLAFDKASSTIYVLECKDISLAKTPYEMGQQISALHNDNPGEKSAVKQALRKAEWVRVNQQAIVERFGETVKGNAWNVKPFVVIDQRMLTPYLLKAPVPIVPLKDFIPSVTRQPARQPSRKHTKKRR